MAVNQNFKQGPVEQTGNALDLVVNGDGFFTTRSALTGDTLYTRNGGANQGWLEQAERQGSPRVSYRLTPLGKKALAGKDVDPPASSSKRRFAYGCTDWTERRLHLGGALGAAVLLDLQTRDIVRRTPGTRVVKVQRGVTGWFGSHA